MKIERIKSNLDNLELELAYCAPKNPIGIVQILHGMNQHKEKYFDFMETLSKHGYVAVIHDQRGHGNSVRDAKHLGYFYTEGPNYLVEDMYQVTEFIKNKFPNLGVTLFGHSLGTLVCRNYIKTHDTAVDKMILTGPPGKHAFIDVGILGAKICKLFYKKYQGNKFINNLTIKKFNNNFDTPRGWICDNEEMAINFIKDPKSNYTFTTNGFIVMFKLIKNAYKKWTPNNKKLKILLLAGEDDPVITNKEKFMETKNFLSSLGYISVKSKIYKGKRHDLINSKTKEVVLDDIFEFLKV